MGTKVIKFKPTNPVGLGVEGVPFWVLSFGLIRGCSGSPRHPKTRSPESKPIHMSADSSHCTDPVPGSLSWGLGTRATRV